MCLGCQDGAEVVEEASHHARWRPNWCAGRVLWAAAIHTLSDHPIHSKRVSGKKDYGTKRAHQSILSARLPDYHSSDTVSATYLQNVDLQRQPGHALTRE